jgi:hypothetical protein
MRFAALMRIKCSEYFDTDLTDYTDYTEAKSVSE